MVENLVNELRDPNPMRGTRAVMDDAADLLEKLELQLFRLKTAQPK